MNELIEEIDETYVYITTIVLCTLARNISKFLRSKLDKELFNVSNPDEDYLNSSIYYFEHLSESTIRKDEMTHFDWHMSNLREYLKDLSFKSSI